MEYDFSDKAKDFLESQSAKRSGPKGSAQTPPSPLRERRDLRKMKKDLLVEIKKPQLSLFQIKL